MIPRSELPDWNPVCHLMVTVLAPEIDRQTVMQKMKDARIQTSIHYPPVHLFSCYRDRLMARILEITESLGRRLVTLPLYPGMTRGQVKLVCDVFRKAIFDQLKSAHQE